MREGERKVIEGGKMRGGGERERDVDGEVEAEGREGSMSKRETEM